MSSDKAKSAERVIGQQLKGRKNERVSTERRSAADRGGDGEVGRQAALDRIDVVAQPAHRHGRAARIGEVEPALSTFESIFRPCMPT